MIKILSFTLFFAISMIMLAQNINSPQHLTKQDYLQKSKNKKTAGWILRGSGAILFSTGIIWGATSIDDDGPSVLLVASGVCILSSVPLFVASRKSKRRAMSMSFNWQQFRQIQNGTGKRLVPSLFLKAYL